MNNELVTPSHEGTPLLLPLVDNVPDTLKHLPQWVIWRGVWLADKGKYTKVPYQCNGSKASSTNPNTWTSFDEAVIAYQQEEYDGIGFVVTEGDQIVGIDLDHCVENGVIATWAHAIVDGLGSYAEVSPSGTGIRIFLKGKLPPDGRKKGNVECYETGRFLTVTGHKLPDAPCAVLDRQEALNEFHAQHFPVVVSLKPRHTPTLTGFSVNDNELLERAFNAKNGSKLKALYDGDFSGYPSQSEADLTLCVGLAFWTGDNPDHLDRLFRGSGLYRNKWDEQHGANTYGATTVIKAISGTSEFYDWGKNSQASANGSKLAPRTVDKAQAPDAKPDAAEEKQPRKSQADLLVELVLGGSVDLFHDPDGTTYADICKPHRETHRLRSKGFTDWLKWQYYQQFHKTPGAQAVQDALGVLEGKATYDGQERPVYVRVASSPDGKTYYLDLGNVGWQCVEITAMGWQVVTAPSVRFRRPKNQQPLPIPQRGGNLTRFLEVFSIPEESWPLVLAWLVMLLNPHGPYPILILGGEHGTGKSTLSKFLRSLIDPSNSGLRSEPREVRDLLIGATNSWVLAFDNLSGVGGWLSDALCRLSTGGGFATRTLYADDEETILDATRPVILNGIGELASRPDLLDRALLVNLEPIPTADRRPKEDLDALFTELHPYLLGALLDAACLALKNKPTVKLTDLPRMADFAVWVTAAEPGLPIEPGEFIRCYTGNRQEAHTTALDNPVATALRNLIAGHSPWIGTATDLLKALETHTDDSQCRARSWPKDAKSLGKILTRLAPNFRAINIEVRQIRSNGIRGWHLEDIGNLTALTALMALGEPEAIPRAGYSDDSNSASRLSTDGTVHGTDGTVHGTDGTVHGTDGTVYNTDGTVYNTDGTVHGTEEMQTQSGLQVFSADSASKIPYFSKSSDSEPFSNLINPYEV